MDKIEKSYDTDDLLRNLLERSLDNIYFKDEHSRIILCNETYAAKAGFSDIKGLLGKTDFEIFDQKHAQAAFNDEKHIMETGKPLIGYEEKEIWSNTNQLRWASTSKMPLVDLDGKIIGTFGISRDITEQKEAEQKIIEYTERLAALNQQMNEELMLAERFQRAFLPRVYPAFDRSDVRDYPVFYHKYLASGHVGGDFCAIRKLSATKVSLFICDVMGHGVRSALITGMIRTMIDDLVQKDMKPGEFLSQMNKKLFALLSSEEDLIFVTACYVIIDLQTGYLTYANAGHPRPLIKRNHSRQVLALRRLASHQPALGLQNNAFYETGIIHINSGDIVFLYTDGILEATGRDGDEFGQIRLIETLAAEKSTQLSTVVDRIAETVCAFHESTQFSDDICIVSMQLGTP